MNVCTDYVEHDQPSRQGRCRRRKERHGAPAMSEPKRMTGERLALIFSGRILASEKGEIFDEIQRARASEAEKDKKLQEQWEIIRALVGAVERARLMAPFLRTPDTETGRMLFDALEKAGALP